jgi:DNA-binding NtrC family response regulator
VSSRDTLSETSDPRHAQRAPRPGIVVVFSKGSPRLLPIALDRGTISIGRDDAVGSLLGDERLSRHHATLSYDGALWTVRDLGSLNGTMVDGVRVDGRATSAASQVVRAGNTVFMTAPDVSRFDGCAPAWTGGVLRGPVFGAALDEISRVASSGDTLLIRGESGAGKELAARAFHGDGPLSAGPFVAVNCATIPEGVAERLLFGAKRGAFSGATADVDGYVQAAEGGVLFLDEIGELDLAVQAKLLRVLETREVTPLGGTTARRVAIRFCAATHRDLRSAVAEGRFRADLYFRLGESEVVLPALRERREEIPWLLAREIAAASPALTPHVKLVEACLLRAWPGNVRELLRDARAAAGRALAAGADVVREEHLRADAGMDFVAVARTPSATPGLSPRATPDGASALPAARSTPDEAEVCAALARASGNVSAAARALGLHRTQLIRLMKKLGLSSDPGEGEG